MDAPGEDLFEWRDGVAYFHGLKVESRPIVVGTRTFTLARMHDAADLLDLPEFGTRFVDEDRAPYGLELWPGACMLADKVWSGEEGAGRAALELGAGLALVSFAATLKGWRMTAADYDPIALRFARYNAGVNGIALQEYLELDWRDPPTDRQFDRVFGADILYQLIDHEPVLRTVKALLAPGGVALLSDPNRLVADRVPELARQHGFKVEVEPVRGLNPATGREAAGRIFHLR